MQLKYLNLIRTMSLKKPVLWNCVLQVQLHISLPDKIFKAFFQKQNHYEELFFVIIFFIIIMQKLSK